MIAPSALEEGVGPQGPEGTMHARGRPRCGSAAWSAPAGRTRGEKEQEGQRYRHLGKRYGTQLTACPEIVLYRWLKVAGARVGRGFPLAGSGASR